MTDPFLDLVAAGFGGVDTRPSWYDDPAAFARDCIAWPDGTTLAPYQAAVLSALPTKRRVAVRSLHGAGKSATAALTVLWFALSRDLAGVNWKCLTTASVWRQLEKYLWPEVKLWARRIRWDAVGRTPFTERELLDLSIKLAHGEAFAAASDDPEKLEGAHADSVLIIADEAKAIPVGTFDALEGAMSGTGEVFALVQSTPGLASGRFYDIHVRKPGTEDWWTRHIRLEEVLTAGRVAPAWVEQRRTQWGETSALFMNRVLGEFATEDEDGVIPLSWVEAAIERWREWDDAGRPDESVPPVVGVDVARGGADKTVLAFRRGSVVSGLERLFKADTMATTGEVARHLQEPGCVAAVDVIGVGAGVVDRLREQGRRVSAFHASSKPAWKDRSGEVEFLNARAAAWWRLRELLDPTYESRLALPDDDLLTGDLCAPRWSYTSAGKLQVESKDEIRKRLGRSPDSGDAVMMAFSVAPPTRPGSGRFSPAVPYTDEWVEGGAIRYFNPFDPGLRRGTWAGS